MKTINILKVEEKVYFEKLDNGLEVCNFNFSFWFD